MGLESVIPSWAAPKSIVTVRKGATLHSCHPSKKGKPYEAAKSQKVLVARVTPGYTIRIGDVIAGNFTQLVRLKDVAHYAAALGFPDPYKDETATFKFLRGQSELRPRVESERARIFQMEHYGSVIPVYEVFLHAENPRVIWAGRGGYWVEADIADCDPV